MEEALESTTPFLTIDPMVSSRLAPVHKALTGGDWAKVVQEDEELESRLKSQGVETPTERDSISWDDANLFFLSCVKLSQIGQPMPLEAGISKERFGRFPFGDGSPMTYLRDWIRDSRRDTKTLEELSELLEKLATGLSGTSIEKGVGRLEMRGWLSYSETTKLRKCLTSKCWMPAADEPLDGGCHDAAKHLVALLRAAEKRDCGIVLRVHN
ncbi:MAG: hypothetical protein CMA37_05240 [Euryarchaeota archaeon]|nr:hypothetical protein [Euryarchaeota archaeon]|tara:strand:+ start:245 stop:880 length:636 start_codon:yes stop_codon:yes gene_type:complete